MGFLACLLGYFGAVTGLLVGIAMVACAAFAPPSESGSREPERMAHASVKTPSLVHPVAQHHVEVTKTADAAPPRHLAAARHRLARREHSQRPAPRLAADAWSRHLSYAQDMSSSFGEAW